MYQINFVEKIPNFLRWVLIPVVSALAYVLVSFAVNIAGLVMTFLSAERGGWGVNFWTYLVSPGVSGYVAVYAAAVLAPHGKLLTAIVMAGVWFVLSGFFAYASIMTGQWSSLIAVVSTIFGCGFSLFQLQDELRVP